jgi:ERCC4-type nuclease
VERRALRLGDYSISGLEEVCVVERKDLSDLVRSFTVERPVFVARLRQMAEYPHRLLVVTAALSQLKSPYPHSAVNPNQITQSLIAVLAGLRYRLSALRRTKWEKRFSPRIYIRCTFISGCKRTD